MPDSRFYETQPAAQLSEIASLAGVVSYDRAFAQRWVSGVAPLSEACTDDVSFCVGAAHRDELIGTAAGVCLITPDLGDAAPAGCVALVTTWPQAAFAAVAKRLVRPRTSEHGAPAIDPSATLEPDVGLGPGAVIGAGVSIGRGSRIGAGAIIGPGVSIGRECWIGARAVVGFALLGDRVTLHAGAVIGEPGFGAAGGQRGVVDLPQMGRVILQDGVTVGANSCIDRGAFGDTVVGENTKIDNLVQIAHNVIIGRNCVIAAQTGISGSTVVGDGCMFGGQAGVADHITIGAGARIAAAAGVMKDIPAGESWGGTPARPMVRWMRETATLSRLVRRKAGG